MKYRIAILGNTGSNPATAYSWFVRTSYQGLTLLGHEVIGVDIKSNNMHRIREILWDYKPHILFSHVTFSGFRKTESVLSLFDSLRSALDTIVIHSVQDARTAPRYKGNVSHAIDMALVGQTQTLENLSNVWKIPTYYFPYSSLVYKNLGKKVKELSFDRPVFTGGFMIHKDRYDFIRKLMKRTSVEIIETKSSRDLRNKTLDLAASAKCILGLCTGYDIEGYIDVRPWQYLGAGAFMICRKFKGMDKLIPDDLYIPFNDYSEKSADFVIQQFSKFDRRKTRKFRNKAFKFMQSKHTCKHRMSDVIDILEGKKDKLILE